MSNELKDRAGITRAIEVQQKSLTKWEADPTTAPDFVKMALICVTIQADYEAISKHVLDLKDDTDVDTRTFYEHARDWQIEAANRIVKLSERLGYKAIVENPPVRLN
jgi:hypothetical protein